MLRSYLLKLVRLLGLAHVLDYSRFFYFKLKMREANAEFVAQHPDFILPPDYLVYESFRLDYAAYYRTGQVAAHWIKEHFATHEPKLEAPTLLDWGCGPGRVLRHLPAVFGSDGTYYGADPNVESIEWCKANLDGVHPKLSRLFPPLPFHEAYFDLIYGISIFTHLSAEAHPAWIEELLRVLKPGGMALLTTHGPAYRVKLTQKEQQLFDKNEWVIRGGAEEGHRVYTAYHPPQRFRALVNTNGAEVLTYVAGQPADWGIEQDTWIIRKLR